MHCRDNCGACCIQPSISSAIPGMPDGKPSGVPCVNLTDDLQCAVFNSTTRPKVCSGFNFDPLVCGTCRKEAMQILGDLEGVGYNENKDKYSTFNSSMLVNR